MLRRNRNHDSCEKSVTGMENTGIRRIPAGICNLQDYGGSHDYYVLRVAAQNLDLNAELMGVNGHNKSFDQFRSKFMAIN